MKKFYTLALIIFTLFSCVVFSACRDNYSNLRMSFYSTSGSEISAVNLVIDSSQEQANALQRLGVRFDGISESDIGNISIQSSPSELATISNLELQGNTYYFTVEANMSGNGQIVVTHMTTGRTAGIALNIGRKSSSLQTSGDVYIVDIPSLESQSVYIKANEIVSLSPTGSTDRVYFKSAGTSSVGNVEFITETVGDEELITGFVVGTNVVEGSRLTLYPVTVMDGYENTEYTDTIVTFEFINVLEEFEIETDSFHQQYINNDEVIYLITNDHTENTASDDQRYNYNNFQFNIGYRQDDELLAIDNYLQYYDVDIDVDETYLFVGESGDKYIIQANAYSANPVDVKIKLVPKNCVGDIHAIEYDLQVKCEVKPNNIEVSMQGELIDPNESLDLYDYYVTSGSALGALFNFNPVVEYSLEDMKSMRIEVSTEILNAYILVNGQYEGVNRIFTDDTFTTLVTDSSYVSGDVEYFYRNSRYVLEFYLDSQPLRFYFDTTLMKFVSEPITNLNSVYIRYVETNYLEDRPLNADVSTFYTVDVLYLEDISGTTVSLNFNRQDGVSSMDINAGYLMQAQGSTSYREDIYVDDNGVGYAVETVYLNRLQGQDNTDSHTYLLYIAQNNIVGYMDKTVTSASFSVSVLGGEDNPLTIKQYASSDTDGKYNASGNRVEGSTSIEYQFSSTGAVNNAILLLFDSETDVGEYRIIFTHSNGYTKEIVCYVYQQISTDDIECVIPESDRVINNIVQTDNDGIIETSYKFPGYEADYIVASNQTIDVQMLIDNVFNTNYIVGYEYSSIFNGIVDASSSDYIRLEPQGNRVLLTFLNGTYFNETNNYINIRFTVRVQNYSNIITPNGYEDVTIVISFFIYEEIGHEDLMINNTSLVRFVESSLGAYNKDDSKATLQISISDENLWNYTQMSTQDSSYNIGIQDQDYRVVWYTENGDRIRTDYQTDNSISLTFTGDNQSNASYREDIYAEIVQFNTVYTLRCLVTVQRPIITQSITITSDVNITEDINQEYYLDLRAGQTYQLTAENYSPLGEVSNPDIFMVVVNSYGNQNNNSIIIDNDNHTLTVRETISNASNLSLIVFAKDALNQIIDSSTVGFDNISSFMLNERGELQDAYLNAYVVINLYLTDGTRENPFIINDANDFWDINSSEQMKSSYYRLMTNIDLTNTSYDGPRVIDGFSGYISTYSSSNSDYIYTLYGITLNGSNPNLFTNFNGTLSNINFNVAYNYSFNETGNTSTTINTASANLGLIDVNYGRLENININYSGRANLYNGTALPEYNFGSLVGINYADILYTSSSVIGADGSITLYGDAVVNFGGLVGKNYGLIQRLGDVSTNADYSLLADDNVEFGVYVANEGALSVVNIVSNLVNEDSSVGGVVGYNTETVIDGENYAGRIQNGYVTGTIQATHNNVGGAIGKNQTTRTHVTLEISVGQLVAINKEVEADYHTGITSAVVISGQNYVGGIVGYDDGGIYKDCHYQILTSMEHGVVGSQYVGGIAGYSMYGYFAYCSVMSYRWDYSQLNEDYSISDYSQVMNGTPDIAGENYISGLVGVGVSDVTNVQDGGTYLAVSILNSSVNAYIQADNGTQRSNVAGLISSEANSGLILYAYFMGRMDGDVTYSSDAVSTQNLVLDNMGNSVYNNVYSVVIDNGIELNVGSFSNAYEMTLDSAGDSQVWGWSSDINGGYIYLKDETGNILFELAPTSINAEVIDPIDENFNTVLHLNYYDFALDTTDENYVVILNELTELYNTYSIKDLIAFTYQPESLESIRIYVQSSNSSIIGVSNDKIIVNGVGQCVLTFISSLNQSVRATITIDVSRAYGEDFVISDSAADISGNVNGTTQNIVRDSGKQFYAINTGSVGYQGIDYSYRTDDPYLEVTISLPSGTGINIGEYLNVSGLTSVTENDSMTVRLTPNIPFSISVLQHLEGMSFSVEVRPYSIINYNDTELIVYYENVASNFEIVTSRGASDISINYDSVTLYPNDTTTITAYIKTDLKLGEEELLALVGMVGIDGEEVADISNYIELIEFDDYVDGIQTVYYRVTFNQEANIDDKSTLIVYFQLPNGINASAEFTLLPQRINTIEIKNYIYNDYENRVISRSDVLRPVGQGLIIIDIAPINGYFDYLEISDITGSEEIIFAQIDGVAGARMSVMDNPSSDGTGIQLLKYDDVLEEGRFYVSTMISSTYSSMIHTIRVSAYLDDGTQIGDTTYYNIDVKMLPSIDVNILKPNGDVSLTFQSSSSVNSYYIANGVDTNLRILTSNSNGNVDLTELSISGVDASLDVNNYFALEEELNGFYTLRAIRYDEALLGGTLTLGLSTTATLENGDYETAEIVITFDIVDFIVHDVSVTNSRVNASNANEIYGDYSTDVTLEFYFRDTDISVYNQGFWDREYRFDSSNTDTSTTLGRVNAVLRALNENADGTNYLYLYNSEGIDSDTISLNRNVLRVNSGNRDTFLYVNFNLVLDMINHTWTIESPVSHVTNNISNETSDAPYLEYRYSYILNFVNSNTFEEAELIKDEEDFLNMAAGENTYYILGRDLVLTDYTPLDIVFKVFDGNGHTITIESFAEFDEEIIYAGLFRQVSEGMVIMNLEVNYSSVNEGIGDYSFGNVRAGNTSFVIDYADLCTSPDVNYSAVYFGGITPVNNGIITNCSTSGEIAVHASTVEDRISGYAISFYMGGLVCQNNSTAFITNSNSNIEMYAQANIGGLAYSNAGKIASSSFTGLIYGYNNNVVTTSLIEIGGFVVNNTGEISMSYVDVGSTALMATSIGNISAKDISAGFVYNNTSSIYDCYVTMSMLGANNNTFSGFVQTNQGTVNNCYTFINQGNKSSSVVNMFAPTYTTGITSSYEIMIIPSGYNNRIEGLTTVSISNMYLQETYQGFVFGDNENAVWTITLGGLPQLVSTLETVEYTGESEPSEDMYYGLRNVIVHREEIVDEDGHITYNYSYEVINGSYGTKDNPYVIYDLTSWNNYFMNNPEDYFRLVADIDFSSIYGNPNTSTLSFYGNIQGNNMDLTGLMIYSSSSLDAIGLFKEMVSADDISISNAVRNLDISVSSVLATKTQAVGSLAGIVEGFNLYNIDLDASGVIVVGGNAVGGVVGLVRGEFDIERITSNVGANSTRASSSYSYSIYTSTNNEASASQNLSSVYYAGSVFGIIDGYNNARYDMNDSRNLSTSTYFNVSNIVVNGNITVLGDTIGSAFGLVGERVMVDNVSVDLAGGALSGTQYSGGIAGENRGVITNSNVVAAVDTLFNGSNNVSAGLVGLNLGGLVQNSSADIDIVKSSSSSTANPTVGGLVGRNVEGSIYNSTYDGNLLAYYTGGIVGASYSSETLQNRGSGSGAISNSSQIAIPNTITYVLDGNLTLNAELREVSITVDTLNNFFTNLSNFYYYIANRNDFSSSIVYLRVLGLAVGATDEDGLINRVGYDSSNNLIVFNGGYNISGIGVINDANIASDVVYDLPFANIIDNLNISLDYTHVMYTVGAVLTSFDAWGRQSYSDNLLVFTSQGYNGLTFANSTNNLTSYIYMLNNNDVNREFTYNVMIENYDAYASELMMNFDFTFLTDMFDGSEGVDIYLTSADDADILDNLYTTYYPEEQADIENQINESILSNISVPGIITDATNIKIVFEGVSVDNDMQNLTYTYIFEFSPLDN